MLPAALLERYQYTLRAPFASGDNTLAAANTNTAGRNALQNNTANTETSPLLPGRAQREEGVCSTPKNLALGCLHCVGNLSLFLVTGHREAPALTTYSNLTNDPLINPFNQA